MAAPEGNPITVLAASLTSLVNVLSATWTTISTIWPSPQPAAFTAETTADAVAAGLGITHLFCHQVSHAVAQHKLKVLMRDFEPPPFPVNLVYPGGRRIPQKLRALLDFCPPRLRHITRDLDD